jgi:hypothetical protein
MLGRATYNRCWFDGAYLGPVFYRLADASAAAVPSSCSVLQLRVEGNPPQRLWAVGCHWHFRLADVETSVDGRRTRVAFLETRRMQMTPNVVSVHIIISRSTWPTRSPSPLHPLPCICIQRHLHGDNLWPLAILSMFWARKVERGTRWHVNWGLFGY